MYVLFSLKFTKFFVYFMQTHKGENNLFVYILQNFATSLKRATTGIIQ